MTEKYMPPKVWKIENQIGGALLEIDLFLVQLMKERCLSVLILYSYIQWERLTDKR